MTTLKFTMACLCLSSLVLLSCSTYYYIPTQQNVLKFKRKGDVVASIGADEHGHENYSVGYAVTDHLGFLSDFKTFDKHGEPYRIDDYFWDNEVVIYSTIGGLFYPAINIGYGFGELERNDELIRLKPTRQFIQPSIGYSGEFLDFALSTRLTRTNYDLYHDSFTQGQLSSYGFHDVGRKDFLFIEPAVTVGAGYNNVKVRVQWLAGRKITSSEIAYVNKNTVVSLNLLLNINQQGK